MTTVIYRPMNEDDFAGIQAVELEALNADTLLSTLSEHERNARVLASLAALRFYARTGHSFVAAEPKAQRDATLGYLLAQAVWHGDRPTVHVSSVRVHADSPAVTLNGLLRACVKSAYDSGVYEVRLSADNAQELQAAQHEGFKETSSRSLVRFLGSRGLRSDTLPEDPGQVM